MTQNPCLVCRYGFVLFFFNDTAPPEIYPLSLHDALPISSRSNPSTVVTCLPATAPTGVRHERTGCPSSSTVQAPHCPSPQPYFVPVRSSSSRRTPSRLRSSSPAATRRLTPLMSISISFKLTSLDERRLARRQGPTPGLRVACC